MFKLCATRGLFVFVTLRLSSYVFGYNVFDLPLYNIRGSQNNKEGYNAGSPQPRWFKNTKQDDFREVTLKRGNKKYISLWKKTVFTNIDEIESFSNIGNHRLPVHFPLYQRTKKLTTNIQRKPLALQTSYVSIRVNTIKPTRTQIMLKQNYSFISKLEDGTLERLKSRLDRLGNALKNISSTFKLGQNITDGKFNITKFTENWSKPENKTVVKSAMRPINIENLTRTLSTTFTKRETTTKSHIVTETEREEANKTVVRSATNIKSAIRALKLLKESLARTLSTTLLKQETTKQTNEYAELGEEEGNKTVVRSATNIKSAIRALKLLKESLARTLSTTLLKQATTKQTNEYAELGDVEDDDSSNLADIYEYGIPGLPKPGLKELMATETDYDEENETLVETFKKPTTNKIVHPAQAKTALKRKNITEANHNDRVKRIESMLPLALRRPRNNTMNKHPLNIKISDSNDTDEPENDQDGFYARS